MGGETETSGHEYPGEVSLQSGLLPTPTVDAKYKDLHEDIVEAKTEIEKTPWASQLDIVEKWLWLFHPNDIALETVYIRTLVRNKHEVGRRQQTTCDQMEKRLADFVIANLSAAQTELERGSPVGSVSAIHREDSRLFGGFYLRPLVTLANEFLSLKDFPNLKDDMTYHQDLGHVWGSTLRWLAFNFLLFWLTSLAMMSYQNGFKLLEFPYRFLTGHFSTDEYRTYGFLRNFDEEEAGFAVKHLLAVFMVWAIFYAILVQILTNTQAGRQFPWIINFVHVQLAVMMGVATQYLGSFPNEAGVHQLNYATIMIIPQLINAVVLAVVFTLAPTSSFKIVSRFLLVLVTFLTAFLLSKIYHQTDLNPYALLACVLIAAGWCLMINHDRRLMGCLEDVTKFDHNSKLRLQGWLFPSIWLLPFIFVMIVGMVAAVLAVSIGLGILIALIAGALANEEDKKDGRASQHRKNNALSDGAAEVAAGSCTMGGCFAFVMIGNLFQCIMMEETQRTKYLEHTNQC